MKELYRRASRDLLREQMVCSDKGVDKRRRAVANIDWEAAVEARIREHAARIEADLARLNQPLTGQETCPDCGRGFCNPWTMAKHQRRNCKARRRACSA